VVSEYTRVYGNAQVYGNAKVSGNAQVYGNAKVSGYAKVLRCSDIVLWQGSPHSVTITPQNIAIGCQVRPRFGKGQWSSKDKDATPELIKHYKPILKLLKSQVKRSK
jgi:hypothetical protein